jgi:branched-chain amino acid transport system ATP-binding protein
VLDASDVRSGYGNAQVVNGVDFTVEDGEIVTIIGPNGSGKSTFLKTIIGLVPWREGEISWDGVSLIEKPAEDMITEGISYVPQRNEVFRSLTVEENLIMGGWTVPDEDIDDRLAEVYEIFPMLQEFQSAIAGNLSGGQQRMVAIASALLADPDLFIMDEPSAGLAPDLVDDVFEKVVEINKRGTTILLTEQNAKRALQDSDRSMVLVMGENRLEGPANEVMDSAELEELYLGED